MPSQSDYLQSDSAFAPDLVNLHRAVEMLNNRLLQCSAADLADLPTRLPEKGIEESSALPQLANLVLDGAQKLDTALSFAHMDPPTPWITWAMTLWNARLNQNLLHPATAPVARDVEKLVVDWLAPYFGMDGGHMVPGSTVANLTALWAARDLRRINTVAAPETAHVSIAKAAHILGLNFRSLLTDDAGRIRVDIDGDLSRTCLVLVAGATSSGVIDPLELVGRAAWTHVDAAWAGPLRLSERHAAKLAGIERADSVAVSAHKWLFQPKESALVMFADSAKAHAALSFGGAYLAVPNIGLLGSHGAMAVPLLATLLTWGRKGMASRIERCMDAAERFAAYVKNHEALELLGWPETGVILWRPQGIDFGRFAAKLPNGLASTTMLAGQQWLRCVAANPVVDIDAVIAAVEANLNTK